MDHSDTEEGQSQSQSPMISDTSSTDHTTMHMELSANTMMSEDDVASYLLTNGIPEKFCDIFKENYIDGQEFLQLTEEEIKKMIPPIGIAKKIMRLKQPSDHHTYCDNETAAAIPDETSSSADSIQDRNSPSGSSNEISIPDCWRPEVLDCIKSKKINDTAKLEVVRTLVDIMFTKYPKPGKGDCEYIARKLILKYPFFRDHLGNGYQSWTDRMLERVRNVLKIARKRGASMPQTTEEKPRPKKNKMNERYPILDPLIVDNEESMAAHEAAIEAELTKKKPKDTTLIHLMKSTYFSRRPYILEEAISVSQILEKYPALNRPAIIEKEMDLILKKDATKEKFINKWLLHFVPAILKYSESSHKKLTANLKSKQGYESDDDTDEVTKQVTALEILNVLLDRGSKLSYFYDEYSGESIEAAASSISVNHARIAVMISDVNHEFFVVCEQKPLCKVPSLEEGIFVAFAAYYTFNLEYPKEIRGLMTFLQDYIYK